MINMIVDRCYDSYIITMQSDGIDEDTALLYEKKYLRDVILTVFDCLNQSGKLRRFDIQDDECDERLVITAEASVGNEEVLSATVDVITTAMDVLAEAHPDDAALEA